MMKGVLKVLKIGSKGVQVTELQADLTKLGFSTFIDGVFGAGTEASVKRFQQTNKLTVDGVVGPKTQAEVTRRVLTKPRKAEDKLLSNNFNEKELACKHCGEVIIVPQLVTLLQKIRDKVGKPITITSGYRCPTHNRSIGGAVQSRHMQGQAADIVVKGLTPAQVAKIADGCGAGGIGTYKSGFTHVDVGPVRRWNG